MSNIDQEFVEYVVKSLVNNPDKVVLARTIDEKGVLLELTVDPEDLGRVIGKHGNTAQSIRTLLRALGTKNDARYNLKIVDNGEKRPERPPQQPSFSQQNDAGSTSDDQGQSSDDNTSAAPAVSPWAHLSSSNDAEAAAPEAQPEEQVEENVVEKTKKELADLDDLDI
jgi:predicted RNA-binding protein YlqC (UPF0109 family)